MAIGVHSNYSISELLNWKKANVLRVNNTYQRNLVWNKNAKSYLIDSILNDFSIPEIMLYSDIEPHQTVYYIVDGQQRINAIFDYLSDGFRLSDASKKFKGKKFSELSDENKIKIRSYEILTRKFKDDEKVQIREVFKRMNKYVTPLNNQELRHATYDGCFISLSTELSVDQYWNKFSIFTNADKTRMLNIEFISELIIIVIDGIRDKSQGTINHFYEKYESEFSNLQEVQQKFKLVLDIMWNIMGDIQDTWYKRKYNFYSLFAAFAIIKKDGIIISETSYKQIRLELRNLIFGVKAVFETDDITKKFPDEVQSYVKTLTEHAQR